MHFQLESAHYFSGISEIIYAATSSQDLPVGETCRFNLTQISPSGEVVQVNFEECEYASDVQDQLRVHLLEVELPYKGYERVFSRRLSVLCVQTGRCLLEGE